MAKKHQKMIEKRTKLIDAGFDSEIANCFMGVSDLEAWAEKARGQVASDPEGYHQKARLLEALPKVKEVLGV